MNACKGWARGVMLAALLAALLAAPIAAPVARALEPLTLGAGMAAPGVAVYADASLEDVSLAVLGATEVEILETAFGAVRIAYYDPASLSRETGWAADDGKVTSLRNHLTPGPYYQNIHPDADVLSEPRPDAVLLGRLREGAAVEIAESTSDWVRIILQGSGGKRTLGWVVRSYIVPRSEPPKPIVTASGVESTLPPSVAAAVTPDAVLRRDEPAATAHHTATLNSPNPEKPTSLTSRPDRTAMSYGDYYNGVEAEYLSYDPLGYVRVRIGTTEGYWPATHVWIDAPLGMVPSAIPSARVAAMSTRLNMRSHPNTRSETLAQYVADQPLEVLAIRDDWMQVRVDGLIGYVASAYVVKMVNRYVDPNTIPVNPPFYGRFSPTTEPSALTPAVTPTPTSDTKSAAESPEPPAAPDTAASPVRPPDPPTALPPYAVITPLNGMYEPLLERPDEESRVLGSYSKGVIVTIDAVYDAYYVRVRVGMTSGYMALASLDVENVPRGAPNVYADSLPRARASRSSDGRFTLYAAPSSYADAVGSCSPGQTVVVLGTTSAWSHVAVNGRVGYIRSEYIE